MSGWVRLCQVADAPAEGQVGEYEAGGVALCVARANGHFSALDNLCPHRQGPLGQGWIEGTAVICPWHSWAFDLKTGEADFPHGQHVRAFPVRIAAGGGELEVELG